jgi:VanZ family protein
MSTFLETHEKFFMAWAPVFIYAGIIFTLSSFSYPLPFLEPLQRSVKDYFLHAFEYAILGLLLGRALCITFNEQPIALYIALATLLGTLYGLSDELHQSIVPLRQASPHDAVADAVGAFIGATLWGIRLKRLRIKQSELPEEFHSWRL